MGGRRPPPGDRRLARSVRIHGPRGRLLRTVELPRGSRSAPRPRGAAAGGDRAARVVEQPARAPASTWTGRPARCSRARRVRGRDVVDRRVADRGRAARRRTSGCSCARGGRDRRVRGPIRHCSKAGSEPRGGDVPAAGGLVLPGPTARGDRTGERRARRSLLARPRCMMVCVPRAISRCPNCGEPVSPFAAGCAICGTDLEAARAELAAKRARRPSCPPLRLGDDAVRIGVGVIAAVFSPVMGALLTGYFAYDGPQRPNPTRNVMICVLGFSLIGVFAYARLWGGLISGSDRQFLTITSTRAIAKAIEPIPSATPRLAAPASSAIRWRSRRRRRGRPPERGRGWPAAAGTERRPGAQAPREGSAPGRRSRDLASASLPRSRRRLTRSPPSSARTSSRDRLVRSAGLQQALRLAPPAQRSQRALAVLGGELAQRRQPPRATAAPAGRRARGGPPARRPARRSRSAAARTPRPPPARRSTPSAASAWCRSACARLAASPRSALVTTSTSGTSMIPAFRNWSTSPEAGWTTTATVSQTSSTSVSD